MGRRRSVVAVGMLLFGAFLFGPSAEGAEPQLSVTPNPLSTAETLTVGNQSGPANTCAPPSAVEVRVVGDGGTIASSTVGVDDAGNWSATFAAGSIPVGTYEVQASCLAAASTVCSDGTTTTGTCTPCSDGTTTAGSCQVCTDGSTAGSCTPCSNGGTTIATCEVCPDNSTAPPGQCEVANVETTVEPVADPEVRQAVTQAAAGFEYEPVVLEVYGGVVSGRPSFTG